MNSDVNANGKKVVLAVDDVSLNLTILKNILSNDYDVRVAKSGKLALTILGRLKVDLILLDIEMPEMSGFDLMEIIRENPDMKDIPIICVTSHTGSSIAEQAAEYGAHDLLSRPIDADVLKSKVTAALT